MTSAGDAPKKIEELERLSELLAAGRISQTEDDSLKSDLLAGTVFLKAGCHEI